MIDPNGTLGVYRFLANPVTKITEQQALYFAREAKEIWTHALEDVFLPTTPGYPMHHLPQPGFCQRFHCVCALWVITDCNRKALLYPLFIVHLVSMVALPDVHYRQRVQKRLIRLRKRLLAFVIKANPECFDHGGRLTPGCFPSRLPLQAAYLHLLMRGVECKLAMLRCHADCVTRKS